MALPIPTTEQIAAISLANIEAALNQTTPANDEAFNRVIAGLEAGQFTTLYKFGVERAKQCLAITATREDLDTLARNYGIEPKGAVAAVLTYTLPAATDTDIPVTTEFVGDVNGVRYRHAAPVTAVANVATITGTAQTPGTAGNLQVSDTLTIGNPIPGAESTATVTAIVTTGTEAETQESLRIRVLDEIRTEGGGGNAADYRKWAQETPGVERSFPYSGNPPFLEDGTGSIFPGQRTVYIKADESIDVDGIPPQSLLDEAREFIRFNLDDNNRSREPLGGDINATLFVEPIIRTGFNVVVSGLTVSADIEAQVKANISTALTTYFKGINPFIDGLDTTDSQNNVVTNGTVGAVVQNVVGSAGGSFTSTTFDIGAGALPPFILDVNQLAKLNPGGVSYI